MIFVGRFCKGGVVIVGNKYKSIDHVGIIAFDIIRRNISADIVHFIKNRDGIVDLRQVLADSGKSI